MIKNLACVFALVSSFSCSSAVASDPKSPSDLIHEVHILQDEIVNGDMNAQSSLPKLLNELADRMLDYRSELWNESKNLNALVVYILSGGQPRVGRKVAASASLPEISKKLLFGALAYVSGNETEAIKYLKDFNPRTFSPALGSHLALVQASLIIQENPNGAMKLLDLARLLSPGTLTEEAALRREVFLADDIQNLDRFVFLTSQYLRRFKSSLFFENFRTRFTKSIGRFAQRNDQVVLAKLVPLINLLTPQEQLSIYLMVAQEAIINGKATSARLAGRQAANLAKHGSVEFNRATLYNAIISALQNDYEKSLTDLEDLRELPLPIYDIELKNVIIAMLRQSHKIPETWTVLNLPEPSLSIGRDRIVSVSASELINEVREKLSETDQLVKDVSP